MLSSKEIQFILSLISEKYGFGYSNAEERDVKVGQLQAKLSIMLEMTIIKTQEKKHVLDS